MKWCELSEIIACQDNRSLIAEENMHTLRQINRRCCTQPNKHRTLWGMENRWTCDPKLALYFKDHPGDVLGYHLIE